MGILSNTVSICQFQARGDLAKEDLFAWAGKRLAENGFMAIDDSAEESSAGWVHIHKPSENSFAVPHAFLRDYYLAFSIRRDLRRVPSSLLKARVEQAESEFLAANPGMRWVPRDKKAELREAVQAALLSRALPVPSIYDAIFNTRTGNVIFTSLNTRIIDIFVDLFEKTFEMQLVPVHPFARAEKVVGDALKPTLHSANRATTDTVLDLINDNRWLGWDFLLWLIYQTDQHSSEYPVTQPGPAQEGEKFVAYLNDRVILTGGNENGLQKVTVSGPQDNYGEVRTALQNGKKIIEAAICMEKKDNLWKTNLKGDVFHFASLKSPPVKVERDNLTDEISEREAVFYEKMHVLEEGLQLFDSLYAHFLADRLGSGWEAKVADIIKWLG